MSNLFTRLFKPAPNPDLMEFDIATSKTMVQLAELQAKLTITMKVRDIIQDRYNHASLNDKPEVAAAMKELLERMERV